MPLTFPMDCCYFKLEGEWFLFESEEQMRKYTSADNYDELGEVQYPCWFLYQREINYGYNEEGRYYIYSIDQVIETLTNSINFVNSL